MVMTRLAVPIFSMIVMVLAAGRACGQDFPSKPIRIQTGQPGGGNDVTARMIAQGISGPLGQPVIVENRASIPNIAAPMVAKSAADGYTLLLGGDSIWLGPLLRGEQPDLGFLSPLSMLGIEPQLLAAHPSLPVKSIKELIALAKARPGELNYAASTFSSAQHLAGLLFNSMAGTNIVSVAYKGTPASINATLGGEAQVLFQGASLLLPHSKSGRLRALAVTSLNPSAVAPGIPTVAASGLPGYEIFGADAMWAAPKTPAAIINRLNQEIVRFLRTAEIREKYLSAGAEVVASSPDELAARTRTFTSTMGKVIKDNNIKVD